jgi:hypothetical protein
VSWTDDRGPDVSVIATELARGDSGLADKLVQNWKISVLLHALAPQQLGDPLAPSGGTPVAGQPS